MLQELEGQMKIAGTLGKVSPATVSSGGREMRYFFFSFSSCSSRVCAPFLSRRFVSPPSPGAGACVPRREMFVLAIVTSTVVLVVVFVFVVVGVRYFELLVGLLHLLPCSMMHDTHAYTHTPTHTHTRKEERGS